MTPAEVEQKNNELQRSKRLDIPFGNYDAQEEGSFHCSPATRFGHLSDTSKKAKRTSAVSAEHYIRNKVFVSR
jgi:hypothetical protein